MTAELDNLHLDEMSRLRDIIANEGKPILPILDEDGKLIHRPYSHRRIAIAKTRLAELYRYGADIEKADELLTEVSKTTYGLEVIRERFAAIPNVANRFAPKKETLPSGCD